jgi:hypothetical protein
VRSCSDPPLAQALAAIDLPCACTTLRKAARAISRIYDEALAGAGINVTQLAILRAIGRAGDDGAPLSRLAENLVMDNTSLYRGLGPLIRSRWIGKLNEQFGALFHTQDIIEGRKAEAEGRPPVYQGK